MENATNGSSEAVNLNGTPEATELNKTIRNEKIKETLISTAKVAGQAALTIVSAAVFGYVLGATLRSATAAGERRALQEEAHPETVTVEGELEVV
jgi:hypothetical protein